MCKHMFKGTFKCALSFLVCARLTVCVRTHAQSLQGTLVLKSKLTFSQQVSNLTSSSHFHLRRLRAIRRSVSSHVFTSIVHAFVCSQIDYCNSLLVGLPKVPLSPLQSVLDAAARLIARLPPTSHISAFIFDHL